MTENDDVSDQPEPEVTPGCARCLETDCVCRWLPGKWHPTDHRSYIEHARRCRDRAAAEQASDCLT